MRMKPRFGLGLLLILASGALLFYNFTWATLSGGAFKDGSEEWWRAVLGTMFRPGDAGLYSIAACVGLVTGVLFCIQGLWSIVRGGVDKPEGPADDLDS